MTSPNGPAAMPACPVDLLDWAVEVTQAGGRRTLQYFDAGELTVDRKADGTPVTAADRASEAVIRRLLAGRFPDDGILGEEQGVTAGVSGRRWVVDPLDGTKAFARGVPLYAVLLALEDEAGTVLGVIDLPALETTVAAGRGLGCFEQRGGQRRRAHVRDGVSLAEACVTTSGYELWPREAVAALHRSGAALRTWGDGFGFALLATGRVDAVVEPVVAPWDLAPMPVVIGEAGGRFSDFAGRPRTDSGSAVAAGPALHGELLGSLVPAFP